MVLSISIKLGGDRKGWTKQELKTKWMTIDFVEWRMSPGELDILCILYDFARSGVCDLNHCIELSGISIWFKLVVAAQHSQTESQRLNWFQNLQISSNFVSYYLYETLCSEERPLNLKLSPNMLGTQQSFVDEMNYSHTGWQTCFCHCKWLGWCFYCWWRWRWRRRRRRRRWRWWWWWW